jgi:chromosome transmission fidelity protein 8
MIIPLRVDEAKNDWSLIEFQGDIIAENDMKDVHIGNLTYVDGVPILRIGNHVLNGKIAKLPKSFAIMKKENSPENRKSIFTIL